MILLSLAASPLPTPTFNPDDVTPGPIGFAFIFLTFVLVALIALDLIRRVRRVRHREQVREKLTAELAERDAGERHEPQAQEGRERDGDESRD